VGRTLVVLPQAFFLSAVFVAAESTPQMAAADTMMPTDDVNYQLTPRSAAQTLVGYQENHQIELFMQEMLSAVFAILPEDPFEYMTYHLASHRPAPPPPHDSDLCGSGALYVLLPGGDLQCPEHWRLRRCWLTSNGTFCISKAAASVMPASGGLLIKPLADPAPQELPLEPGATFYQLGEDDAARPFAFGVTIGNGDRRALQLAAGSDEQRDEWI